MANTLERSVGISYDPRMITAQNALVREVAVLGAKLEGRKPAYIERELTATGLPYRLYYTLDAYPPLDNTNYETVERYLSGLYGYRDDIRILGMAFSGHDSWLTVGLAVSYPGITEDVAIEDRIVNPKTESDLGSVVRFDHRRGTASVNLFGPLGTRSSGADKAKGREIYLLTPEVLFAASGIVLSEQDLSRWSIEFVPFKT